LIKKQKELYRIVQQKEPKIARKFFDQEVKSENNEFIDCNPTIVDEILRPTVQIKSESDEIELLEDEVIEDHQLSLEAFEEELFCDSCEFFSNSKKQLETHMKVHVKKEQQNFYYCEFCSREFQKV
jgi:hypothetical protein